MSLAGSDRVDLGQVDLAEVVASFGALLRRAGVPTNPSALGRFASALQLTQPKRVDELYWLAKVNLVSDHSQFDAFERTFNHVFRGVFDIQNNRNPNVPLSPSSSAQPSNRSKRRTGEDGAESAKAPDRALPGTSGAANDDAQLAQDSVQSTASHEERLRDQAFGTCTEEELLQLRGLLLRFRFDPPRRLSYRTQIRRRGEDLDLRATLRAASRTGGDPLRQVKRRRRTRPRRVVLLADVSGSMESYARAYLYLLHSAVRAVGAEAFVFSTGLHRLTRPLALAQPEHALRKAMDVAPDWSGGTRIGEAMKRFNDEHGRRGLGRGAVIVIVSDGWEGGDPTLLGQEMERLSRLAHKIIWVNPRKQHEAYRPLVGGMAAALEWIDTFVSGHSINALDEVVAAITATDFRGPNKPSVYVGSHRPGDPLPPAL